MSWWDKAATVAAMVVAMEVFAWATHKYVMHGLGWGWHRSHHEPRHGWWEKNDLYAISFAVIVVAMFTAGAAWSERLWWVAMGITVYGAIYAFVHDMLVHQRGGFRWVPRVGYFKRLVQAHKLHHAVRTREGTVSHGFLFAGNPARLKARLRKAAKRQPAE